MRHIITFLCLLKLIDLEVSHEDSKTTEKESIKK